MTLSDARIIIAADRIRSGYYDRPDVLDVTADRLIDDLHPDHGPYVAPSRRAKAETEEPERFDEFTGGAL